MTETDLKTKLEQLEIPGPDGAEERAWSAVLTVYEEEITRRREEGQNSRIRSATHRAVLKRTPLAIRLGGFLAVLAVAVVAISPARALVADLVKEVFDGPRVSSTRVAVNPPGGGRLLVEGNEGTWVVETGGSRRLLGDFTDPVWSPRGRFVAAVDGRQLAALEPDGDVRWALTRPTPIRLPSWNSPDGFRIAYIEGNQLRIVAGDGTGDSPLTGGVASVRPVWRPGPAYDLAFARPAGRVEVVSARSGDTLFSYRMPAPIAGLEWSEDGTRLLAWTEGGAVILGRSGRRVWRYEPRGNRSLDSASLRPGGNAQLALLEGGKQSRVVLAGRGQHPKSLLAAGDLAGLMWSPDGKSLMVGWREADQWLFLQGGGLERVDALAGISAQFSPGSRAAHFPRLAGWCCAR